ncbi:Putative Zn-dependent protease, contains TPR repeats [Limimonas halophila]|uniref:Putative Zn-dependent protease, contains TPR repeats n=1 Tax=Limimonas halophila TaxID=1082479 RepID=A0A1G7QWM7_9PROT|nr:M48 family metalloprotease [Limimonas halophila]SDG02928.1 Putative Zn-dependent protease, contains TPR repeats [Limimonas halophila]
MRKIRSRFAVLAATVTLAVAMLLPLAPGRAQAQQGGLPLIRDAEIEHTLRAYSDSIFEAAGLQPRSIKIHLVNKDSLNAFVTPGRHMFFHTGLLLTAETPLEVMGVVAHEAGHIASGDIAGRRMAQQDSSVGAIASMVLGVGAAVLTGQSDVGLAVTQLGQGAIVSNLLAYTRAQEGTADQAAVSYLNEAGYSPRGLMTFMKKLEGQTALLSDNQEPFLQTHPLTRDRIKFLQQAVETSPHHGEPAPLKLRRMHKRMQAKLDAFLSAPEGTLRDYAGKDTVAARYARAIAHYREPDLDKALELVDGLIADHPDDPYFHELKGQMLFENGRIRRALEPYRRASELRPNSQLIRLGLAEVQLQLNESELTRKALDNVNQVLDAEPRNAFAWRLAAIAHGRLGDKGMTAVALAESALAKGDPQTARRQAKRAQQRLEEHSRPWLRARDIAHEAERQLENSNG